MNRSAAVDGLSDTQWERFREAVRRFEAAWQQAASPQEAPDLAHFLPPVGDSLRKAILFELVKTDLNCRWRRHAPIFVEHYLTRLPELGPRRELSAELLYEEMRLRRIHGEPAALPEYEARFPDQFPALQRLLQARPLPTLASAGPSGTPLESTAGSFFRLGSGEVLPVGHGYRLLHRIGSGSFGEVWKAEAPGGVEAAIKIIFRPLDHASSKAELRALELIKQLRHPYLLSTQAYWSLEDRLVIVMELADGSLRGRLKQCVEAGEPGIPPLELVGYFREAAEALDYLHSEHVHHRDVKPDNLLLLKRHAKVADFGLARLQETSRIFSATGSGTPAYMAPEVWQSKVSLHSDQYSLAMSYAELRLVRRPFSGTALADLMIDHLQHMPDLDPLPQAEQAAILKAAAKQPEGRYGSCQEFMDVVERAVRAELYPAPAPPPAIPALVDDSDVETQEKAAPVASVRSVVIPEEPVLTPLSVSPTTGSHAPILELPPIDRWKQPAPRQSSVVWWTVAALLLCAAAGVFALWAVLNSEPRGGTFTLDTPRQLVIGTGEAKKTLLLPLHRDHFQGTVALTVLSAPQGVSFAARPVAENDREVQIEVAATSGARRGESTVLLEASGGTHKLQTSFSLIVVPLPPSCVPESDEVQADLRGDQFYRRIASVLPSGERVPFVLVVKKRQDDPSSFYIMRDKVSVGLFRQFVHAQGLRSRTGLLGWLHQATEAHGLSGSPWWNPQARSELPALAVFVEDAHAFAESLHGLLPTTRQWDTAAGRYEVPRGEGPYQGTLAAQRARTVGESFGAASGLRETAPLVAALAWIRRPAIGVDLIEPLPVGEAYADRSPCGCRDMAGNGAEWVRNLVGKDEVVPLRRPWQSGDDIELRGRGFEFPYPLRFKELEDERKKDFIWKPYGETGFDVGFRVVLEP